MKIQSTRRPNYFLILGLVLLTILVIQAVIRVRIPAGTKVTGIEQAGDEVLISVEPIAIPNPLPPLGPNDQCYDSSGKENGSIGMKALLKMITDGKTLINIEGKTVHVMIRIVGDVVWVSSSLGKLSNGEYGLQYFTRGEFTKYIQSARGTWAPSKIEQMISSEHIQKEIGRGPIKFDTRANIEASLNWRGKCP